MHALYSLFITYIYMYLLYLNQLFYFNTSKLLSSRRVSFLCRFIVIVISWLPMNINKYKQINILLPTYHLYKYLCNINNKFDYEVSNLNKN